jgi:glycine/D-amino acid oxidase-like deaminating enzyme
MRTILIVGAGQAGLMLALSLQRAGYEVTVMSARTPESLRKGRVMSTRYMFWPALALERERDLHLWEEARAVRRTRRPCPLPLRPDLRTGGPERALRPHTDRGRQGRAGRAVRT